MHIRGISYIDICIVGAYNLYASKLYKPVEKSIICFIDTCTYYMKHLFHRPYAYIFHKHLYNADYKTNWENRVDMRTT